MAEYDYDDEFTGDDLPPNDLRRKLKEANARAKAAEERASEAETLREQVTRLQREGVIRDAGITLNEHQRTALAAVHGGDWNPDAIKQTAANLGFIAAQTSPPDDPSLAQHEQIAAASAGTDAPTASRDAEIDAQIAAARNPEELLSIMRAAGRPIAQ